MFILDGKILQLDVAFEHDGVQYAANWLRLASAEDRAAIGIEEVPIQPRPDDRFYYVEGPSLVDGSWTAIPKDLDMLKKTWSEQFKQTAYANLLTSDWMVVRKIEANVAVPAEWTTYRDSVRTTCELAIGDMEATNDIDAFIASVTSVQWPISPNSQQPGA